ncbi:hypothetical protein MGU_04795 [Metarhizium guizhouense ARSEF 977]|uniref:Uncharacterized protein n=1 Tax=Metarhizium guizhouense (strain ARSEF 977) TaxID=1276136 RepID=A0A0B4HDP7_METGA|nr:hypothetical protein MGU_04795 [Metarhizium guizhouense ARSEF 977]
MQISWPLETCSSVVESDASGDLVESYCREAHEHHPRLLNTTDDSNMTSPPADAVDPVQTDLKSPGPSSPVVDDSTEALLSQFVFVPQSDDMLPEPTHSVDIAPESHNELYPSHQLETRSPALLTHDFSSNNDGIDASANVRQATQSPHMPVPSSGTKPTSDATDQIPINGGQLTDASSDDARDLSDRSREGRHTVESKRQCLDRGITVDDSEGKPREPNPRGGSNKRRRRKARKLAGEGSDSDNKFILLRKS